MQPLCQLRPPSRVAHGLFLLVLLCLVSIHLSGVTVAQTTGGFTPITVSTGFTSTNYSAPLATTNGASDANWNVTAPAAGSTTQAAQICIAGGGNFAVGSWVNNGPNSNWIAVSAFSTSPGAGGPYNFTSQFTLPITANLASLALTGSLTCDNNCVLLLNGLTVPGTSLSSPFGSLIAFTAPSSYLVLGVNSLTLMNTDFGAQNGVRLEGSVAVRTAPSAPAPVTVQLPTGPTCVKLLTPNVTTATADTILLTDTCQLSNVSMAQLDAFQFRPVCRFAGTQIQTPGSMVRNLSLNSVSGINATLVVACPLPTLLPVGSYPIQLSLDGGASFLVPFAMASSGAVLTVLNSSLSSVSTAAASSAGGTVYSALNTTVVSLAHPYDAGTDRFPGGWNVGDVQLIQWSPTASQYFTVVLQVAFEEWNSTSLAYAHHALIEQPCILIHTSAALNEFSYVWVLPDLAVAAASMCGVPSAALVQFAITGHYSTSSLSTALTGGGGGGSGSRRLLQAPNSSGFWWGVLAGVIGNAIYAALPRIVVGIVAVAAAIAEAPLLVIGAVVVLLFILATYIFEGYLIYIQLYGDVHLISADGLHFDFQAIGVYWLLLSQPAALMQQLNTTGFEMQLHLQPLTQFYQPGSPAALSYAGVTYMAGIAIRDNGFCGVVQVTPRASISPVSGTWFDVTDDGVPLTLPYVAPFGSVYSSSLSYQLSCATIYFTSPTAAVVQTNSGFNIQLVAFAGYGRLSTLSVGLPAYAYNTTSGLIGSWDGNVTNDLIDASGHDWRLTYPGSVDTAAYAFGQTWTVSQNQSFFISVGAPQITCNHSDTANTTTVSCLFGATNATNLLNYAVNVPAVIGNLTAAMVPTVPAVWPNTTLQSQATALCEAGLGIFDVSNVMVQNCLLDVYATNMTSQTAPSIMTQAQQLVLTVMLPPITVLVNTAALLTLQINASLALTSHGGVCSSLSVVPVISTPVGSPIQCVYVVQTGTATFATLLLSSVVTGTTADVSLVVLSLPGLPYSASLNVRVALLVLSAATGTNGTQTSWVTAQVVSTALPAALSSSSSSSGGRVSSSASSASISSVSSSSSSGLIRSSSASSSSGSGGIGSSGLSSSAPVARVLGDPLFMGLRGQRFQVHGIDGAIYNLITERDLFVNARFGFLDGPRPCPVMPSTGAHSMACWSHPGSYLTEIAVALRSPNGTLHCVLATPGNASVGFSSVLYNGATLATAPAATPAGLEQPKDEAVVRRVSSHELDVRVGHFSLRFDSIDGFVNLASLEIVPPANLHSLQSHGLLGQTWRHPSRTNAKTDKAAAIEGEVDDYALATDDDMFGTSFPFNMFDLSSDV